MMKPDYTATPGSHEARYRSYLITAVFGICLVIAMFAPQVALYFLLLQIPVDPLAERWAKRG